MSGNDDFDVFVKNFTTHLYRMIKISYTLYRTIKKGIGIRERVDGEERNREPERRRRILEAALRVFSEKGFGGASLRAIAREAGVTQPLIYWYFEGKEDLFGSMLSELSPLFEQAPRPGALMDRPPEEVLGWVARTEMASYGDPKVVRLIRVVFAESFMNPEEGGRFLGESQGRVLRFLVAYLERQTELGALKEHNAQSAARSFFGSLVFYVLSREIFPHLREGLPDEEEYAKDVVEIFLDGLRADGSGKGASS
jgi:TetR/AcrR family transcriptional repressor of mexJK operon